MLYSVQDTLHSAPVKKGLIAQSIRAPHVAYFHDQAQLSCLPNYLVVKSAHKYVGSCNGSTLGMMSWHELSAMASPAAQNINIHEHQLKVRA